MKLLTAAVLALCLGLSLASCPNDCSGNGECNIYSACECYRNWMGADCSERVCYFGVAFVDTPQGDLNSDSYVSDQTFKTRFSNTPTWEIYPTYAGWGSVNYQWAGTDNQGKYGATTVVGDSGGEAHFYKECSAKGVCDRGSGLCECFEGYEGSGCTRVACPNGCSGHGACRTINEVAGTSPGAALSSLLEYTAWDADASQVCLCEPGYFGVDCSLRKCPMGDDPVTKYESYTKLTFKSTTNTENHDLAYPSVYAATTAVSGANNAYDSPFGFTSRIWAQTFSGDTDVVNHATSGLGWNPWYVVGDAVMSNTANNHNCYYEDTHECENYGVRFKSNTASESLHYIASDADFGFNTAAFTHDFVVTGSVSGARGVQRRVPMGLGSGQTSTVMAPGCCYYNADCAEPLCVNNIDCSECDFFSLYLSDVEGEFQSGDRISITWDHVSDSGAETIHNYIDTISTYYNTHRTQKAEEQVLTIKFPEAYLSAKADSTRFQGFVSLTFTDEFGDEYTTEAVEMSVSGACNPSTFDTCAGANDNAQGQRLGTQSTSMDYYNSELHGDFVFHTDVIPRATQPGYVHDDSDATNAPAANNLRGHAFYTAFPVEAASQDYTGGWNVAAQLEKALEALPNGVTGDVMVEYAYNAHIGSGTAANCINSDTSAATADCGIGTNERHFVIRFMEATGDIPELKANFAFSVDSVIYSNQGCGAVGTVDNVVLDDSATNTLYAADPKAVTVAYDPPIVCTRNPIFTVKSRTTAGTPGLFQVAVDFEGEGCYVDFKDGAPTPTPDLAAGLAQTTATFTGESSSTAKALVTFVMPSEDQESNLVTCMSGGADETLLTKVNGGYNTPGVVGAFVTQTATSTTVDATSGLKDGSATDPYDSSHIWARNGVSGGLGIRGTTENVECSNRGTCDYSSGTCQCYTGFSSKDCSTQNALAAGA